MTRKKLKIYKKSILNQIKDFISFIYFYHYPYNEISFSYEQNKKDGILHIRIEPVGFINILSWLMRTNISEISIVEIKEEKNLKGCLYTIYNNLRVFHTGTDFVVYSLRKKHYIDLISNLLRYGFLDRFPVEIYNLLVFAPNYKDSHKSIIDLIEGRISPVEYMQKEKLNFVIYLHDDQILHLYIQEDKLAGLGINFYIDQYVNEICRISEAVSK